MTLKLKITRSKHLYVFDLPERWMWFCYKADEFICSNGEHYEWEGALVAAKAHAKGKHGVDLDAKRESLGDR